MNREEYISRLQAVYEDYYTGENRKCKFYDKCKKSVKYGKREVMDKFYSAWAQVGELYGADKAIPRIVMVGIEGLSGRDNVEVPANRDTINAHYNGVKYVLAYLLADYLEYPEEKPTIVTRRGVNWVDDALSRYALCNLYRCAFVPADNPNKKKDLHHSCEMDAHCSQLLVDELRALNPEIVVIQTVDYQNYKDAITKEFEIQWERPLDDTKQTQIGYGKNGLKKVCFIVTIHGAYGRFKSHDYLYNDLNPILDQAVEEFKKGS